MSYIRTLEAAGCKVLEFETFGSYQGDWWALCEKNGNKFFVTGCFGSCSVCDAYAAEFGYCDSSEISQERLAAFGSGYLDDKYSPYEALSKAARSIDWDSDSENMVDWLYTIIKQHWG